MSIYVYTYMYVNICIYIGSKIDAFQVAEDIVMPRSIGVCIYKYIHIYVYVCIYVYIYMYVYTYMYVYICIFIGSKIDAFQGAEDDIIAEANRRMYKYIYMHIHVYEYIYTHIYTCI